LHFLAQRKKTLRGSINLINGNIRGDIIFLEMTLENLVD
jgi:hypothetical protein